MALILYACILLLPLAAGLIGFDCSGHRLNITILSLHDIDDIGELAEIETSTKETYIQLLQLSDYDKTSVQHCKVEVDCTIFYCDMYLHIFTVQNAHLVEYCLPMIVRNRHTVSRRERDRF